MKNARFDEIKSLAKSLKYWPGAGEIARMEKAIESSPSPVSIKAVFKDINIVPGYRHMIWFDATYGRDMRMPGAPSVDAAEKMLRESRR